MTKDLKSIWVISFLVWSCLSSQATITLNVDAGDLRTAGGGALMPTTGLVLLVASADSVFGGPTASDFTSGGDVLLFSGNLSTLNEPGYFQEQIQFSLGSVSTGNLLQLYWFPTLTTSSSTPGEGTEYGFYRDAVGINGSAPWVVPGDGATVNLKFLTIGQGGSNPETAGWASQTVAAVPEANSVIAAGLALGLCAINLTRRVRQKLMNRC